MALVTPSDIATAMGTTFVDGSSQEAQAQFFCNLVEAVITDEVKELFTETNVTERLQADYDGIVQLSKHPVSAVTAIKTPAGATRTGWSFDDLDEVDGLEAHEVVDVEYTAGYESPPDILKYLATAVAMRLMVNPNGIRQETVGAMSQTFAAGGGDAGTIFFTPAEQRVLDKYKTTMTTWHIGPRNRNWRLYRTLPTL